MLPRSWCSGREHGRSTTARAPAFSFLLGGGQAATQHDDAPNSEEGPHANKTGSPVDVTVGSATGTGVNAPLRLGRLLLLALAVAVAPATARGKVFARSAVVVRVQVVRITSGQRRLRVLLVLVIGAVVTVSHGGTRESQ